MNRNMFQFASPRKTSAGNTYIGLFIGLVLGMLASAGVVWYLNKSPIPFSGKNQTPPRQNSVPQAPLALPGKPGDRIPESSSDKPRFDFYKILPGDSTPLPDPSKNAAADVPGAKTPDPKAKDEKDATAAIEPVFLQTGSFQTAKDAANQKARLAMMGIEASVQQVMVQNNVWYRVRLGPFKKADDMAGVRSDLAKQGIQASIVK